MESKYKFYMSRLVGGVWEEDISIEDKFDGLKYLNCSGLSDKGAIKNIYTETYAETDELRVYIPDAVARENTDIEMELGFVGEDRRDVYDSFVDYVSGYIVRYWDDCRYRELKMVLTDEIEIDDDYLYGGTPFMVATFKFTNLNGQTTIHISE